MLVVTRRLAFVVTPVCRPSAKHLLCSFKNRALSVSRSATCKAAENDCLERRNSVRPCVPSCVAYKASGEQRTVLEPLENVPTLARAAPKPRGHGVSASMRWRRPRLGRRVRIYKFSQASSAEESLTCCAALLAVSAEASGYSAMEHCRRIERT
jgi:hypothetical protein